MGFIELSGACAFLTKLGMFILSKEEKFGGLGDCGGWLNDANGDCIGEATMLMLFVYRTGFTLLNMLRLESIKVLVKFLGSDFGRL